VADYLAARPLQVAGVPYAVGDTVTGSESWPNVDRWLRLRFLKRPAPASYKALRPITVGGSSFAVDATVTGASGWPNLHRWVEFRFVQAVP
jgi:hypothetical protein